MGVGVSGLMGGGRNCHLRMIEDCLSYALSLLIESDIDGVS